MAYSSWVYQHFFFNLGVFSSGLWQLQGLVFGCLGVCVMCAVHCSTVRSTVLTLPVVPRDRWFICWVIGPIMLAGCMDIVWSMAGVITAPWWNEKKKTRRRWDESRNIRNCCAFFFFTLGLVQGFKGSFTYHYTSCSPFMLHTKKTPNKTKNY